MKLMIPVYLVLLPKTDEKATMVEVIGKPKNSKHKLANTGVYILDKKIF